MLCRQCEESLAGTGCIKNGVCGKSSELADLQDVLIGRLIDISVESFENISDEFISKADSLIADSLFLTLTNTNFDSERISSAIKDAESLLSGGNRYEFSIEKLDTDEDLRSLKELLLYGIKGLAAYYHHAVVLGGKDEAVSAFLRKALSSL